MSDVVNGPGTAGRARLPIPDVLMAGKTGTAQVVSLNKSDGKSGTWKYRDHGLFIFFAPFDNPRRSEKHTSELPSLMRISYAGFSFKKKNKSRTQHKTYTS